MTEVNYGYGEPCGQTEEPTTVLANYLPADEIDDLIEPVCQLADIDTSREGNHVDPLMDDLIRAARAIRDREGFLVTDGDDI